MIAARTGAGWLLLALGAGGCGRDPAPPEPDDPAALTERLAAALADAGPVLDYVGLVGALQAAGLEVEPAGPVTQPFFHPQGEVVRVNGADLQVFQYPDSTGAASAAATVSPDGGTIGTTMVEWTTPPRFYRGGPLVVIELGGDGPVRATLAGLFGPPFAGHAVAAEP